MLASGDNAMAQAQVSSDLCGSPQPTAEASVCVYSSLVFLLPNPSILFYRRVPWGNGVQQSWAFCDLWPELLEFLPQCLLQLFLLPIF